MTIVVVDWGPAQAVMLQRAYRMTNEAFAEKLGAATRTVAKWRSNPDMRLTLEMQEALDTMLATATEQVTQRFEALWQEDHDHEDRDRRVWEKRLASAAYLHRTLRWLDEQRSIVDGKSTFNEVVSLVAERGAPGARASIPGFVVPERSRLAEVVDDYYFADSDGAGPVTVTLSDFESINTTMLAEPEWLTVADDLLQDQSHFSFDGAVRTGPPALPTRQLLAAATARLASVLVNQVRFADEPLYRLTEFAVERNSLRATFALGSFGQYAVTGDLLESEAAAASLAEPGCPMPLRDELLPTVESVTSPHRRLCVGGTLALSAFARPARGPWPADFLLVVQERGERVLNAGHRLAVIPKCFHQPTVDDVEDVHIGATILRELEEELFGREEVDSSAPHPAYLEPMHLTRLTAPMRWLMESEPSWKVDTTGFAFNLLTGNFEIPALVAVLDEDFWRLYGGTVQANWEADRLIRISSVDADGLARLLVNPAWSDEGLLAFALGLQRLARLAPDRVRLPDFQIGVPR